MASLSNVLKVFAVAVIMLFCVLLGFKCGSSSVIHEHNTVEQVKQKPIVYKKDKQGIVHAEKPVAQSSKHSINAYYDHVIDSMAKKIDAQSKTIQTIVAAGTETKGSLKPDKDSTSGFAKLSYNDRWLTFTYDGDSLQYQIRDSLTFVTYLKKKGIFKKPELTLNAFAQNPATHIKGLTGIKLNAPMPSHFGIGLYGGYGWNGKAFEPQIGIGINYQLIRF